MWLIRHMMHEGQGENAIGTLLIFSICKMDAILWLWDDICQKQKEQIMLQRKCFSDTYTALNQFSKSHISLNSTWFALSHGKTSANFCESSFVSLSEIHDISAIVMFVIVIPWIFSFSSMLSLSLQLLVNMLKFHIIVNKKSWNNSDLAIKSE